MNFIGFTLSLAVFVSQNVNSQLRLSMFPLIKSRVSSGFQCFLLLKVLSKQRANRNKMCRQLLYSEQVDLTSHRVFYGLIFFLAVKLIMKEKE